MKKPERQEERVPAVLPVQVDGHGPGRTRDVSANGVFFETDVVVTEGSEIRFEIDLEGPTGRMILKCRGTVVRVEQGGGKFGVAARILESGMEKAPVIAQPATA